MLKHELTALRRQSDAMLADLVVLYDLVKAVTARPPFNVVSTHHEHLTAITAELYRVAPGLPGETAMLANLGNESAAAAAVTAALTALLDTDPFIFDPAPSPRLLARMMTGPNPDRDTWTQAIASADYMTVERRRIMALRLKREARAAGRELPTESDAAPLPDRSAAIAEQMKAGGGALSSRR